MQIGVLALQGAFREHRQMLERMGVSTREVRKPDELAGLDGLIIPGGESTTIGKIAEAYGLIEPVRELGQAGLPIWGTCAGMILVARDIGPEQPYIPLIDIKVRRNAFGRQVDSFETDLDVPALPADGRRDASAPFHAIFIRAPLIESTGMGVEPLAELDDGTIVAAQQGNLLVTSFHPELTGDPRFHELFLSLCDGKERDRR